MKVSIITVVLNNADTIAAAIDSVLAQDHPDIEYVVVDGESTDGTLDIIKSYGSKISKVVSGKDGGIYFAMNKGIGLATGEIVGILNADDLYENTQVISKAVAAMQSNNADTCYGNLQYVKRDNVKAIVRHWNSGGFSRNSFLYGWMPPHPTFFVKKSVYDKVGLFNTQFRSAADYEFMLRVLFKNKISTCYVPEVFVLMRVGGKSNKAISNRLKANNEDRQAWQVNGLHMPFFTTFLKPLRKIPQFIFKP
jgi:glycosyltransferase involved in cell wall biosynthesis